MHVDVAARVEMDLFVLAQPVTQALECRGPQFVAGGRADGIDSRDSDRECARERSLRRSERRSGGPRLECGIFVERAARGRCRAAREWDTWGFS